MVSLLLQLYLLQLELLPTVVAALGRPLVTAVPVRPDQDPPHLARHLQYQAPQQVPDLRQAQAPARPPGCTWPDSFLGCGRSRAAASRASVTCRYQPCALRTL